MKKYFLLILYFLSLTIFAQNPRDPNYIKQRFEEANEHTKNKNYQQAVIDYTFVSKFSNNKKISKKALKKIAILLPFAQDEIRKNISGKWLLIKRREEGGVKKTDTVAERKILIIDLENFSFYKENNTTKNIELIKKEKSNFCKNKDMRGLFFDFIFSDGTLWTMIVNNNELKLTNTGKNSENENSRTDIVCGNKTYWYRKIQ